MPTFAPFIGAVIGAMIYQLMVGFHVEGEVRDRDAMEQENMRLTSVAANENSKNTKEMNWDCPQTFITF